MKILVVHKPSKKVIKVRSEREVGFWEGVGGPDWAVIDRFTGDRVHKMVVRPPDEAGDDKGE